MAKLHFAKPSAFIMLGLVAALVLGTSTSAFAVANENIGTSHQVIYNQAFLGTGGVYELVVAGYGLSSPHWAATNPGVISSAANDGTFGIGCIVNNTAQDGTGATGSIIYGTSWYGYPFAGDAPLDKTDVLLGYTYYGDATMDGAVGLSDLILLAGNYGATSGSLWYGGDFTYDGAVGLSDLILLAGNYGSSLSGGGGPIGLAAPVPEPGTFALLACAGMALVGWTLSRKRKN